MPIETMTGFAKLILTICEFFSSRLATHFLSISQSLAVSYIKWMKHCDGRIVTIGRGSGNGVDIKGRFNLDRIGDHELHLFRKKVGIPMGAQLLVFVGRLATDKGLSDLMESWKIVREKHKHLYLLIAGDRDERNPIDENLFYDLGIDPRIILTGHLPNPEIAYANAYLLIVPSYREGFGNVYIEAAAMGVPAVGYKVTGVMDAVEDGVSGLLVPPHDRSALTKAIETYLYDHNLRNNHGRNARTRAIHNFKREIIWNALREFYINL